MRIWPIVAFTLVAAGTPLDAQSIKAGIEAWQRQDYEAAVENWRPLAQKGDADAAFNMGQAYRMGRGVPLDLAQAQGWLERAARKNHVEAQVTLGLLLFQNGNRTTGLRWLREAAEAGDARAQLVYGTALFNGDGVPRDPVRAYAFVSRAAAQGLAPAKSTLEAMEFTLSDEDRRKGAALALRKATPVVPAKPAPTARPSSTATPKPSKAAPAKASATHGGWRIQLGAFSKADSAEALFRRLAGKPALSGKTKFLVSAGSLTKLQAGPFESRAAADRACAALKAGGQACFAVSAR